VAGKAVVAAASAKPGLSPEAEKFLDQVSGGARREVGAWIGDHFLVRRLKAQLKLLERAHQYLRDAGRDPREVKWNVLFPLLEAASLDEDDDMADRWAALLANAADPLADEVPPSFADVLRQFDPRLRRESSFARARSSTNAKTNRGDSRRGTGYVSCLESPSQRTTSLSKTCSGSGFLGPPS
jgi:hypothetical protein